MNKTDTFKLIVGTILRAVVGLNTTDKYEGKANAPRPMALSRRVIHGCLFTASSVLAVTLGINIPPEAVTALLDAGNKLYTVGLENWPLIPAFWSALMGIVGHIKRKK